MKTKHTPSPWYYEEANIRNEDGLDVATIDTERSTSRSQYDPVPEEEWIANTHLIAAAPDLLEALRYLLGDHQRMFSEAHPDSTIAWQDCEEVKEAKAAIKKATQP